MQTQTMSRRACLRGLTAGAAALAHPLRASATPLAKITARGSLIVGVYKDMPPFHIGGRGVDVELAQALAEALNVKLSLLPFAADENMNDDLRHMVWRGHYLGFGPADVLLHVPVDRPLMDANPRVAIFAPYYRERVAIARNLDRLAQLESLPQLGKLQVAVPGQSLAGWLLIGADSGAYREQLVTNWKNGCEAARALAEGVVAVAAGLHSELESVLRGDPRFAIEPLPSPRAPREGWAVGMAVRRESADLAQALQDGVNKLARSGRMGDLFAANNLSWRAV